jgi:hypothetical protein
MKNPNFVLAVNRRKQPVKLGEAVAGYAVYRKTLMPDGFSVETKRVHEFMGVKDRARDIPASLHLANQMRDDLNAGIA